VVDGGGAADHRSGSNVMGDAALGDGDGSVSNLDVAADADLSGQDYVVAYVGGSASPTWAQSSVSWPMVQLWPT